MLIDFFELPLRTGALIIGCIICVGSFIGIILTTLGLLYGDEIAEKLWGGIGTEKQMQTWTRIGCAYYLAQSAIELLTSSLLILGTLKERHLLVLPWLISASFDALSLIVVLVVYVMVKVIKADFSPNIFFIIVPWFVVTSLYAYIWYGMYSHYKQLQGVIA